MGEEPEAKRARGARIRAVREARGENQQAFAQTLSAKARELGIDVNVDQSLVSRFERGERLGWEEVRLVAAVDPLQRGRDWLAWGDPGAPAAPLAPAPTPVTGDQVARTKRANVGRRQA